MQFGNRATSGAAQLYNLFQALQLRGKMHQIDGGHTAAAQVSTHAYPLNVIVEGRELLIGHDVAAVYAGMVGFQHHFANARQLRVHHHLARKLLQHNAALLGSRQLVEMTGNGIAIKRNVAGAEVDVADVEVVVVHAQRNGLGRIHIVAKGHVVQHQLAAVQLGRSAAFAAAASKVIDQEIEVEAVFAFGQVHHAIAQVQ